MIDTTERSARIKTKAGELGFLACGIAEAGFLDTEAPRLERWLSEERNGAMSYMANHFDLRLDPRRNGAAGDLLQLRPFGERVARRFRPRLPQSGEAAPKTLDGLYHGAVR